MLKNVQGSCIDRRYAASAFTVWNTVLNSEELFSVVGFCADISSLYLVMYFAAEPSIPINQWIEY